ncbi:MAG: hypothetical protein ACYS29_15080 [Planctomycetota bacterium]
MKLLVLKDKQGNQADYPLLIPDGMNRWKVSSFLDFVRLGHEGSQTAGYLPRPANVLRHESLRQMVAFPESTYNPPVDFRQNGKQLMRDDVIDLRGPVNTVTFGRQLDCGRPQPGRISVSQRNKRAFASCRSEIISIVDSLFDYGKYHILRRNGQSVHSVADVVEDFCGELDLTNQVRFWLRMAQVIYRAPFENFSKIIDGAHMRSGYEMFGNIAAGFGGVCAEKTAALRFICDILSVPTSDVIGSDSVIPADFEQVLGAYIDSEGEQELGIDVQHHLIEIIMGDRRYLVDTTNGNVPFVFMDEGDCDRLIRGGFRARMVYRVDRLNMARVSRWAGDALLTIGEYHVPDLHLQYIFNCGLGLHISRNAYIGVYFDWGGRSSALMQNHYARLARRVRFPFPRFIHQNNLESIPDEPLKRLLEETLVALRERSGDWHYTGDFTFVIQPIVPHFWTAPRISKSVNKLLWNTGMGLT